MKTCHKQIVVVFITCLIFPLFFSCKSGKETPVLPRDYQTALTSLIEGNQRYKKGCYGQAIEFMFKAHELFSLSDNQDGVAKTLNNIGTVYRAEGSLESAGIFFDEAIRVYKLNNNMKGVVQALSNKAAVYIARNMYGNAEKTLKEAETLSKNITDTYVSYLNNKGILYTRKKKYKPAERYLKRAESIVDESNAFEYAAVNFALGSFMTDTGKLKKAEEYYKRALKADKAEGFSKGIADGLFALGEINRRLDKTDLAIDYLQRSFKIYTLLKDKPRAAKAKTALKKVLKKKIATNTDLTVTSFFIDLWSDDKRLASPCD